MTELAQVQQRLAAVIRNPGDELADLINETSTVPRAVRLGIYSDAYLLRLDEALRSNYPKLHLLLGDEDFLTLTQAYLATHPSRKASIRYFGDVLPTFLAQSARYAEVPVLAELAQFEWALGSAFDAANADTLDLDALGTIQDNDWPLLIVQFQPALCVLPLFWNAPAVWRALNDEQTPPPPSEDLRSWAIWRAALQPHYRSLESDEAALLAALLAGQPFGTACEALLVWHDEDQAPARAGGLLGQWLTDGWICGLIKP